MEDISEQLARRDHFRRMISWQKTPEQRMAEMARMQQAAWEMLRRSPEGYAHFLRRNFKARAIGARNANGR